MGWRNFASATISAGSSSAWATSRQPRLASNFLHLEPLHEYTQFSVQEIWCASILHEKPAIPREGTLPRLPGSVQSCENLLRSCGDSHSSERVSYLTISGWHVSTARGRITGNLEGCFRIADQLDRTHHSDRIELSVSGLA